MFILYWYSAKAYYSVVNIESWKKCGWLFFPTMDVLVMIIEILRPGKPSDNFVLSLLSSEF